IQTTEKKPKKRTTKKQSSPKSQRKKKKPKTPPVVNKEVVITLNKYEEETDVIIDIDDSSTDVNITDTWDNNEDEDDVFEALRNLLRTLGFEGQEWLKKVPIPPTKCFEMDENVILDFEKEANRFVIILTCAFD